MLFSQSKILFLAAWTYPRLTNLMLPETKKETPMQMLSQFKCVKSFLSYLSPPGLSAAPGGAEEGAIWGTLSRVPEST